MDINQRFIRELRTAVLAEMRHAVPTENWDTFRRQDAAKLLIDYLTWQERIPAPRPRAVHMNERSQRDAANLEVRLRDRFERLVRRFVEGADLAPFLSKRVATAWTDSHANRPLQYREHLDVLLNGWGVHHFHLREGGRNDELALTILRPDDAYVIAIGNHDSFDDESLLADAIRAWPHLFHRMQGVLGLEQPTGGKVADLRNHGVSTFIEVDGIVYLPPTIGITFAGTPLEATRRSNAVMHTLYRLSGEQAHVQLQRLFNAAVELADVKVEVREGRVWLDHAFRSVSLC